jgi:hypothetical protein
MATVRAVESRIRRVEGFDVRILHETGGDVRSDRTGLPQYPFERAMKNVANVRAWRDRRFHQAYPGFEVEVLHASGRKAHGNMLLGTVRDSYLDA